MKKNKPIIDETTLTEVKVVDIKDDNDIMTTIKIPFRCFDVDKLLLIDCQRQYSILVKSALCRLLEGSNVNDTREYLNHKLNNVNDLDTRFSENAILDAQALIKKMNKEYKKAIKKNKNLTWEEFIKKKENRICFRRKNLEKRSKGEITKEEFKENKYLPVTNYGETGEKGNRKFYLDMEKNECVFKLNRNKHLHLKLCKTNKNYLNELIKIQQLMEGCNLAVTFKVDKNYLHISYKPIKNADEEITKLALMDNRIVGVDLNPSNIGLSTLEFKKDLVDYEFVLKDKRFIDIVEINKLPKNKRKRAYIGIVDSIVSYLKSFNTKNIALEDLHMPSKDHGKGKALNNCLNKWNRNLIINKLTLR
jgi:predicted transposase